jgi:hypothetical protein
MHISCTFYTYFMQVLCYIYAIYAKKTCNFYACFMKFYAFFMQFIRVHKVQNYAIYALGTLLMAPA